MFEEGVHNFGKSEWWHDLVKKWLFPLDGFMSNMIKKSWADSTQKSFYSIDDQSDMFCLCIVLIGRKKSDVSKLVHYLCIQLVSFSTSFFHQELKA